MLKSAIQYVLPKADILFTAAKSGILYIKAEVSDIVISPDSQNKNIIEMLTVDDLSNIGSSKNFTDVLGFQDDNTPDAINYINTVLVKSDIAPATEVLSRTVFYNRGFSDTLSAVDGIVSIRPGITFNGEPLNASVLGWDFYGTREILFTKIGKNLSDASTCSDVPVYTLNKNLNDSPTINDSVSITLAFDSTITDESTATEEFAVALQTFFVMNGAMLNNRPIN